MSEGISSDYLLPNLFGGGAVRNAFWLVFFIFCCVAIAIVCYHFFYVKKNFDDMEVNMKNEKEELIKIIRAYIAPPTSTPPPTTTPARTTTSAPTTTPARR